MSVEFNIDRILKPLKSQIELIVLRKLATDALRRNRISQNSETKPRIILDLIKDELLLKNKIFILNATDILNEHKQS